MRVLVGCECSQVVTAAFRAAGHEAFSCDIQPCYGDFPQYHFQNDLREIFPYIKPDLFIAHPPCTYLSRAGLCRLVDSSGRIKDADRYQKGLQAKEFFLWCLNAPAKYVCVENPVPIQRLKLPPFSQVIQPYYFGDPYSKQTCLWLRGLPYLQCTKIVRPVASWVVKHHSQRIRSQTFQGVALAMASQWGENMEIQYTLF